MSGKRSKKREWKQNTFNLDKEVDVVAKNGDKIKVKTMKYRFALDLLKKPSEWKYEFFEIGYHSYKTNC